jgi:hypothetical protein
MRRPTLGRTKILSGDHRTWEEPTEGEEDLLTFENCDMDEFTSFILYSLVDLYHKYSGKLTRVCTILPIPGICFLWPQRDYLVQLGLLYGS